MTLFKVHPARLQLGLGDLELNPGASVAAHFRWGRPCYTLSDVTSICCVVEVVQPHAGQEV